MCADRAGGFTLLEVLVALAIAGVVMILLFRAGSDGVFAVAGAARAEQAVERAQSHLDALGHDSALVPGDTEGDDGGGYHWRVHVAPLATRQGQAQQGGVASSTLLDVEVSVSWAGRGADRSVVLRTRRLIGSEGAP